MKKDYDELILKLKAKPIDGDFKGEDPHAVLHVAMRQYNVIANAMNKFLLEIINKRYAATGKSFKDPAYDAYYGKHFNRLARKVCLGMGRCGMHKVCLVGGADCITWSPETKEGSVQVLVI